MDEQSAPRKYLLLNRVALANKLEAKAASPKVKPDVREDAARYARLLRKLDEHEKAKGKTWPPPPPPFWTRE